MGLAAGEPSRLPGNVSRMPSSGRRPRARARVARGVRGKAQGSNGAPVKASRSRLLVANEGKLGRRAAAQGARQDEHRFGNSTYVPVWAPPHWGCWY